MSSQGPQHRQPGPRHANAIHTHALIDGLGAGGAELLLVELAGVARDAGIDLTVGYLQNRDGNPVAARRLEQIGITPTLVPVSHLLGPRDFARVRRHLADVSPDLVHTHLGTADFLGGLAARSLGLPSLSTLHAMDWGAGDARARVRARLIAAVRRHCATRVVAVSDAARASYLRPGWDRTDRVVTIHNGIAGASRPGAGRTLRAQLGVGEGEFVVCMVSTLRPEKAHELAIAGFRRLVESHPQARLLIVGDGPLRGEIGRLAGELGDRALMLGYTDDVMTVLDAGDALLHPSHFDAFPTALIEAMAAGVPVVASAVGGIPEIVEDGRAGLLLEAPVTANAIASALSELERDPSRRRDMGLAGRRRFEREFSAEAWAQRLAALYRQTVAARGPTAAAGHAG